MQPYTVIIVVNGEMNKCYKLIIWLFFSDYLARPIFADKNIKWPPCRMDHLNTIKCPKTANKNILPLFSTTFEHFYPFFAWKIPLTFKIHDNKPLSLATILAKFNLNRKMKLLLNYRFKIHIISFTQCRFREQGVNYM